MRLFLCKKTSQGRDIANVLGRHEKIDGALLGMNLTRLCSIAGREVGYRGALSVGRVQTPTLRLVMNLGVASLVMQQAKWQRSAWDNLRW